MSASVAGTRTPSEGTPVVFDLTYTSSEEEPEEEDVRLVGFVVSDSEVEYLPDEPDDVTIVKQLDTVKDLGTTFAGGRRVSTRHLARSRDNMHVVKAAEPALCERAGPARSGLQYEQCGGHARAGAQ